MTAEKKKLIIEYASFAIGGFAVGVGIFFLFNWMGSSSNTMPAPIPAPAPGTSNDSGTTEIKNGYQINEPYHSPAKSHVTNVPGTNISLPPHTAASFSKGDVVSGGDNFMYKGVAYILIEKEGSGTGPVAVPLSIVTKVLQSKNAAALNAEIKMNVTGQPETSGQDMMSPKHSNITGPPAGNVIWVKNYWPRTGFRLRQENGPDWAKQSKAFFAHG